MKEFDVRRAIGLDQTLTTAQKYTLIMLCTRLDWHTWTGQVSARDVAKVSSQGERQVKRHLASLKKAGWLERLVELRSDMPRLHHKADTRLNVELVRSILSDQPQTSAPTPVEAPSVIDDTSGESDTSGVYDMGDKGCKDDDKDTSVTDDTSGESDTRGVSDVTLEGCHKRHWGSVISDTDGVSLSPPNINMDQYNINKDQTPFNTSEVEPEPEPRAWRGELQEGFKWCDRCKQHVPLDEPHTYPHSKLTCTDDQIEAEAVRAMAWDRAWGAHQEQVTKPEPQPMVEVRQGNLYFVEEIYDELDYKRQVLRVVNQPDTKLIRDALWPRGGKDDLYQLMKSEKVAPRSAIDWVMIQAGREVTAPTPPPPPPPSNTWTVTVEEQLRIKQIDQAWMNGQTYNDGGDDTW